MENFLEKLEKQLSQKKDTVFVIVTEVHDAAPGKKGAHMLVDAEGRLQGTVGGGSMEYQAVCTAQELLKTGSHLCKEYVLRPDESGAAEHVCGGESRLFFHCLKAESTETENLVKKGLAMYREKIPFWLAVPDGEGEMAVWDSAEYKKYREASENGKETYFTKCFLDEGKVYIFGGGHVAAELVPVLAHVGFRCVVADDREEYAARERFPEAEEVLVVDYECPEKKCDIRKDDYVVVMTRGHQWDASCEKFALGTKAHYIGIMGSRTKAEYMREKMKAEGFSDSELERVTTPIGISIGSETPQEIAVSIAAQLIQVRAEARKKTETGR